MKELRILLICALALGAPSNVFGQEKTAPPKMLIYGNTTFPDSIFGEYPDQEKKGSSRYRILASMEATERI